MRSVEYGFPALVVAVGLLAATPLAAGDCAPARQPELRCLALNVYWETRAGTAVSQRSVAHATLNRVSSSDFPDTVCGVVRQGGERPLGRCQFSWWCDGRSDEPRDEAAWCRALGVARDALAGRSRDPTGGALYFHARTVAPKWASRLHRIARIGAHVYYR